SVKVEWLAIRPFQHDYNGFQPQPSTGSVIYTAQNWSWTASGSHPGVVDSTSPFGYSTAIGNSWNIGSVNGDSNITGGHMFPAAQSQIGWLISGGTPIFTNTLAAAMGTGDTTLTLATPTDSTWSASGYIQIDDEVISYSGETLGATTLTIQRAKYGTIAQTHANGAAITSVGVGSVWTSCNSISQSQMNLVFTSSWTWVYGSFSAQNCSGYNIKFTPSFTGQVGQLYKVAAMAFISDPAISSPMSASLVPVSAGSGPYTWTSTKALAGSGSGITTGPASSTSGNVATFAGTTGQIQDSGTALTTLAKYLTGTSASIGGSALTAGTCASGTVSITGATTAMGVIASPVTYPGDGMVWSGYVSASNTVTVKVCAMVAGTPTASTYNVRVIQ
ncbi:MAG TPA: hypothetical protein VFI20_08420, partial [Terracidiphilus sp.]|nr:hypothetical protein [Terracidiphilus sp.]